MDTFVVRVWAHTADEEEGTSLRGVVEHIASGWSGRFHNTEELVSFLRAPGSGSNGGDGSEEVPATST